MKEFLIVSNNKIFEKENRLFKYYINGTEKDQDAIQFIKSLFKIELIDLDNTENQDYVRLFDILGFDKFFELLTLFGGRTIKLPKIDKIKKQLILAIAYYQVTVLGLHPKEAGKLLSEKLGTFNLKQKSMKSMLSKLQQTMDSLAEKALQKQQLDSLEKRKEASNGD